MPKENLWVCYRCLMSIKSREGNLPTLHHDIDLEFDERTDENSKCDWCEHTDNDVLYELI